MKHFVRMIAALLGTMPVLATESTFTRPDAGPMGWRGDNQGQVQGSFEAAENMAITGNQDESKTAKRIEIPADRLLGLDRPHATQAALFRRFLGLRCRLLPYLYTQAHLCWCEGLPVCRPLLMAFPDDPACNADQWPAHYLLGPDLLVAPVVDPVEHMAVYLPHGDDWVDYWRGIFENMGVVQ